MDPSPSLIVGRPCYHGLAQDPSCDRHLWTLARYGEEVTASMAKAVARAVPPGREIVLIGFSGGGALAVLLARQIPGVVAIVTLAGNLDIDAWTDLHGYSGLQESKNPAELGPLPEGLIQLHLAGAEDHQMPPRLQRDAVPRIGGELRVLPGASHHQGWERHWPTILAELDRRLRDRPSSEIPDVGSRP